MAISQEGEWFINSNTASSRDRAAMQHITSHNIRQETRNLQNREWCKVYLISSKIAITASELWRKAVVFICQKFLLL